MYNHSPSLPLFSFSLLNRYFDGGLYLVLVLQKRTNLTQPYFNINKCVFPMIKIKFNYQDYKVSGEQRLKNLNFKKKKDYSPTHVLEQEQKGVCPEQSQSSIQQFGIGSQYGGLPVLQVPHAPQSELSLHPKLPLY